jgi:hypothetical protein
MLTHQRRYKFFFLEWMPNFKKTKFFVESHKLKKKSRTYPINLDQPSNYDSETGDGLVGEL